MMHYRFVPVGLVVAAVLILSPAFGQQPKKNAGPDPNVAAAIRPIEIIEASGKWESLFDGSSMKGWTGATDKYTAKEGVLSCVEGARQIYSEAEYSDFVFRFEFKLTPGGDSGIGLRVPPGVDAAYSGMEIQILDHDHEKYAKLKPWQVHGSIYSCYPAKTGYLRPVGEWNEETIVCIEDHVMVILNGAVILDAMIDKITGLTERPHPGLRARKGHITIAGHNDPIEFQKLEVKDFSPSAPVIKGGKDNVPPEGFTELFNGKDLAGWKGLAHRSAPERRALKGADLEAAQGAADENMREHWSVMDDGVLTYDGTGMSLCTAKDYGDFEMYVDYKIPPGADSGIYLRGTPQIQIWDPWDPRVKDKPDPETSEEWVLAYANGRNLGSGALWNNKRNRNTPLVLADNKPGEWNSFLIRMVGEKVTIWLNGKLVVDRVVLEGFWDKTGLEPVAREDQIELQHHGSELFFKNLYIRELPY